MAQLKISADTSEAKKSILDLSKTVTKVKDSQISIFTREDKRFMKTEMKRELTLMKDKLKENQGVIKQMVLEHRKLKAGSDAELKSRHKIVQAYKTQAKLAKEIEKTQKSMPGTFGGMGGGGKGMGGFGGMLGKFGGALAAGGLAMGALGIPMAIGAGKQYMAGAGTRTSALGLGINERSNLSPEQIAATGMNEQEFLQRRVQQARLLGAGGASEQDLLQQGQFERAYGLESGQMTNVTAGLRSSFGAGANEAQAKLQASILASGIEDAIGPYLEVATSLLSSINENGMQNTDELIRAFGALAEDGVRTPEQIAQTIQGVDQSIRGSSGEANAFLQTAFARGGIGGGTIGGSRFAIEAGGITGLNRKELEERGYNSDLLNNLGGMGMFGGVGQRSGAILEQFKKSAGLEAGQSIGDITDPSQMIAVSNLANNVFGTEGIGGFDALKLFEQMQTKKISREQFDEKLKEVKEGKNPQVERLDKINSSIAGQTEVLTNIKDILMERTGQALGETIVGLQETDVARTRAQGKLLESAAPGINETVGGVSGAVDYVAGGGLGDDAYDAMEYVKSGNLTRDSLKAMEGAKDWVMGLFSGDESKNSIAPNIANRKSASEPTTMNDTKQAEVLSKGIEKGIQKGMGKNQGSKNNIKNEIKIHMPDGNVMNRTHK